jgi:threonine dehydrogenase-like Zn-dependent dehydrogenase
MGLPKQRKVAVSGGDGHIRLIVQDMPELKPGMLALEVHASLISPGTEIGGWHRFSALRTNPDPDIPTRPFGYSNAGIVLAVGDDVEGFHVGDRVACMGMQYGLHTDYAVAPQNLCVHLPTNVTFAQGSYLALTGTAMQTVRRCAPELGEMFAVVGLGLVGQLTSRLLQVAGTYVIGWDALETRIRIAERWGIDATALVGHDNEIERTAEFAEGAGLDGAVVAFGGDANKAVRSIEKSMKVSPDGHAMGRVVVVGAARFEFPPVNSNLDYRRSARTGPGYHDTAWEYGQDYPPVFVRWNTQSNLALCMRLISEGKLDVDALTTHTVPLEQVDEQMNTILDDPDSILGVVLARQP